jgi:hypothetical protein
MTKPVVTIFAIFLLIASSVSATEMRVIDLLKGANNGDMMGQTCEGMGDINGDGYNDFLTASLGLNELYLYLGGPHPFDNPPYLTWQNHGTDQDLFAYSPVNVGDVNCDGVDDFISLFGDNDSLRLYINLDDSTINDYYTLFIAPSRVYLYRISGGGDNNNDGLGDYWLFYQYYGTEDTIWSYAGCESLDANPDFYIVRSGEPAPYYSTMSRELCTDCDLNGDQIPDIIYGQYTGYENYPGRICIVWGGASMSTTPDLVFYAPINENYWSEFGKDIACLDDISGDGIDDLWVTQGHRNYIYFGGQPFDTLHDIALDYTHMYPNIDNVGDVNNDGYNDVMLLSTGYLFSYVSYIYCYPGMDTLVDVIYMDHDFSRHPEVVNISNIGMDHSRAGDIDGDGIDDILISARETDREDLDNGYLFVQAGWDSIPTPAENESEINIPENIELKQNYPNPFNSGTTIEFNLPRSGYVEVKIYNLLGELICIPLQKHLPAGNHTINWNGRDAKGNICPTGIYFYQITAGSNSETKRMILLK